MITVTVVHYDGSKSYYHWDPMEKDKVQIDEDIPIVKLTATTASTNFIALKLVNIPYPDRVKDKPAIWRGEWAQFIYDNL